MRTNVALQLATDALRDASLAEIMEVLAQRIQEVESMAIESLVAEHAELAEEIRSMVPVLQVMVEVSGADALSILGRGRNGTELFSHAPSRNGHDQGKDSRSTAEPSVSTINEV